MSFLAKAAIEAEGIFFVMNTGIFPILAHASKIKIEDSSSSTRVP